MHFNVNICRLCCLVGVSALLIVSACDKESTDSEKKLENTTKELKKEAKDLLDTAKPEDCATYAKELQEACTSIVDKRLKVPCQTNLIQFEIAQKQADGRLFDTGADNAKVAAALCHKGITKIRKDVAKAEKAGSDSTPWAGSCTDYIATIRKDCLTKIAAGTQADHCQKTIQMLEIAVNQKNDGAMSCGMGAMYFKK